MTENTDKNTDDSGINATDREISELSDSTEITPVSEQSKSCDDCYRFCAS